MTCILALPWMMSLSPCEKGLALGRDDEGGMVTQNGQWSHTSSAPFAHLRCPKVSSSPSRDAFQTVLVLIKQGLNRGLLQELPGMKSSPTS